MIIRVTPFQDLFIRQDLAQGISINNVLRGKAILPAIAPAELMESVKGLLQNQDWAYLKLDDDLRNWIWQDKWQGKISLGRPDTIDVSLDKLWQVDIYSSDAGSVLELSVHHALADGHSFQLFWEALQRNLGGQPFGVSAEIWQPDISGPPDTGIIKQVEAAGLGPVERITVQISSKGKQLMEQRIAAAGISGTAVLLGALQQLVDQTELFLGRKLQTGMALRNRTGRSARMSFPACVNFLPVMHHPAGDYRGLDRHIRMLFRHQSFPLLEWMAHHKRQSAFNVLFSYQKESYQEIGSSRLTFLPPAMDETVLGVHVLDFGQSELKISFDVRTDIADVIFWRGFIARYLKAIAVFPAPPRIIPFISAHLVSVPDSIPLWERFDKADESKTAIIAGSNELTYGEVRKRLRQMPAPNSGIIFIEPDRSVEGILILLKAWRCGRPVSFMLPDKLEIPAGEFLYVAETSGSTGKPKRIFIRKEGIESLLSSWSSRLDITSESVHLSLADQRFDVFFGDLFRSLFLGGTLVVASHEERLSPESIHRLIALHKVSHLESTPSFLRLLKVDLRWKDFLRVLICGSEPMTHDLYIRLESIRSSGIRVINSFGLTETSIDSALTDLNCSGDLFPVGAPLGDQAFVVVDENGVRLPFGVWGELEISGSCVGVPMEFNPQYCQEADGRLAYRTGDQAMLHPQHGLIVRGRVREDFIKVNGRRIPAKEIELFLSRLSSNLNHVVLLEKNGSLVLLHDLDLNEQAIRQQLTNKFPRHVLPDVMIRNESWPINRSGKLDRSKLLEVVHLTAASGKTFVPGGSEMERHLHELLVRFGKPFGGKEEPLIYYGWSSIDCLSFCNEWNLSGYSMSVRKWMENPSPESLLQYSVPHSENRTAPADPNALNNPDLDELLGIINKDD